LVGFLNSMIAHWSEDSGDKATGTTIQWAPYLALFDALQYVEKEFLFLAAGRRRERDQVLLEAMLWATSPGKNPPKACGPGRPGKRDGGIPKGRGKCDVDAIRILSISDS